MNKYCVIIQRNGCIFVEANSEEEAVDIADHQLTDTVIWDEDWHPSDVIEDSSYCREYVKERAFD